MFRWSIINEGVTAALAPPQACPRVVGTSLGECQGYCLEASDGCLCCRVGGLCPLIAVSSTYTRHLWVAELQVEPALIVSVVLQLVQDREQMGIGVVRVPAESILLAGEQSSSCVVAKYFYKVIL